MSGIKLAGGVLRELRIHLCQTSTQSAGVRDFIKNNYVSIKKDNPGFPILIRECNGVQPRVWARYEKGHEVFMDLRGLSGDQVKAVIQSLIKPK